MNKRNLGILVSVAAMFFAAPLHAEFGASHSKRHDCRRSHDCDRDQDIIIYNDNRPYYGDRRRPSYYYPYGYEYYYGRDRLQDRGHAPASGSQLYNEYQSERLRDKPHPPGLDMSPLKRRR